MYLVRNSRKTPALHIPSPPVLIDDHEEKKINESYDELELEAEAIEQVDREKEADIEIESEQENESEQERVELCSFEQRGSGEADGR